MHHPAPKKNILHAISNIIFHERYLKNIIIQLLITAILLEALGTEPEDRIEI